MSLTTVGVKLDDSVRDRLRTAATKVERTPHWLIKQAIYSHLEMLERGHPLHEVFDAQQPPVGASLPAEPSDSAR